MSKGFKSEKQRKFVMAKLNKNITNKEYVYGDIDGDGTPNVDDRYPLDPDRNERVNEVLISEELKKIEDQNETYREGAKKLADEEGGKYRIKHPHSVVNKLRRKHHTSMKDLGAVRVIVADKPALDRRVKKIRAKYKDDIIEEKNYYENPKGGYYYAHHFIIKDKDGRPIELQVQTKRMSKFYLQAHEGYKREWDTNDKTKQKRIRRAKKLKELDENG